MLTEQERQRFAEWLEREALTSKGLIEQMKKLGPAMNIAMQREQAEAAAALLIARKLRATQSMSVGGGNG
jgi:hypothetical protein